MYRVRDLMTRRVLYVTPQATVQAAMDLLRLQQLEMLPVVQNGVLIGVLDSLSLYRFHGELPVREAMTEPLTTEPDTLIGEAASLMLQHHLHQLPVVEGERLVGLLSHRELVATWGAAIDARTGLPGHDFMLRWASGHLVAGREVAILFIDLNDFGRFNKTHGHVVGDRVLKTVAGALREPIDAQRDLLCRFGGDEFAVATTRTQEEAWALARAIHEAIARAEFGEERLRVEAKIGIAGGKRHMHRPGSHPWSNVDDLINWASRASTRAKSEPGRIVAFEGTTSEGPEFTLVPSWQEGGRDPAAPSPGPRIVVDDYSIRHAASGIEVTVYLRRGDETKCTTTAHTGGEILQTVASATGACLGGFLPSTIQLGVSDIRVLAEGEPPGVVIARVRLRLADGEEEWLIGAVKLQEDRYRSVINAVLDATNRRLSLLGQLRATDPRPEAEGDARRQTPDASEDGATDETGRRGNPDVSSPRRPSPPVAPSPLTSDA